VATDEPWLMLGDCLDRMKEIPDGSVDLVCCDPPYGTTQAKWDSIIPLEPMWREYQRVLKPGGNIVLNATQPFSSMLVMSNTKWFRYEIVWVKGKRVFGHLDSKRRPMRNHELVLVFYRNLKTYNPQMGTGKRVISVGTENAKNSLLGKYNTVKRYDSTSRYPLDVLYFDGVDHRQRLHPTQKPEDLMDYLILTYSNPGDVVLDNAMGSGTTIVSALKLGRKAIGIEKEPGIFEVARKRIEDHRNGVIPKPRRKKKTGTQVPLLKGFE
jgi:site-specific DNA-methyltransferase (adenine-specific)